MPLSLFFFLLIHFSYFSIPKASVRHAAFRPPAAPPFVSFFRTGVPFPYYALIVFPVTKLYSFPPDSPHSSVVNSDNLHLRIWTLQNSALWLLREAEWVPFFLPSPSFFLLSLFPPFVVYSSCRRGFSVRFFRRHGSFLASPLAMVGFSDSSGVFGFSESVRSLVARSTSFPRPPAAAVSGSFGASTFQAVLNPSLCHFPRTPPKKEKLGCLLRVACLPLGAFGASVLIRECLYDFLCSFILELSPHPVFFWPFGLFNTLFWSRRKTSPAPFLFYSPWILQGCMIWGMPVRSGFNP